MNKVAWELWYDDQFLVDRIKQQEHYLLELKLKYIHGCLDEIRYNELRDCALFIKSKFEHQLSRPHPITKTY